MSVRSDLHVPRSTDGRGRNREWTKGRAATENEAMDRSRKCLPEQHLRGHAAVWQMSGGTEKRGGGRLVFSGIRRTTGESGDVRREQRLTHPFFFPVSLSAGCINLLQSLRRIAEAGADRENPNSRNFGHVSFSESVL
jgi:hypothetical protein